MHVRVIVGVLADNSDKHTKWGVSVTVQEEIYSKIVEQTFIAHPVHARKTYLQSKERGDAEGLTS